MTMSEDPLQDDEFSPEPEHSQNEVVQDPPQPVKRKGGRKPVYTTVQERKQRNRMAQAAFRERRTEYIKQLEEALKENEDQIKYLQRSTRETTEECHMLRYKTTLLEEMLYENGIDYHSELQSRSSKSLLSSAYTVQPGNKQGSTSQMSPEEEQSMMQGVPNTTPQLRPIKRKTKSSSVHNISTHGNQPFDMKSEPSSARPAPMITSFDSPGLLPENFDYSNGAAHSMESALNSARLRFEDTRIDPSISIGEVDAYYSMAPHHVGMHLDSERESRTSSLDENTMRGSRYESGRQTLTNYQCNVPGPRSPQNLRAPQNLDHPLRMRQHALTPAMQNKLVHEKNHFAAHGQMELDAAGMLGQGALLGDFELDAESLD